MLIDDDEEPITFDFERDLEERRRLAMLPAHIRAQIESGRGVSQPDWRKGTVVCRHWVRGWCMKGDNCDYLHRFDLQKMPPCRHGQACQNIANGQCFFTHGDAPKAKAVCPHYRQGFCPKGSACLLAHIKMESKQRPEEANWSCEFVVARDSQLGNKAQTGINLRRPHTQERNANFKTSLCKHFERDGVCPYGSNCHFAHGKEELKKFPQQSFPGPASMNANRGAGYQNPQKSWGHSAIDGRLAPEEVSRLVQSLGVPGIRGSTRFFIIKSSSHENLHVSVLKGVWRTRIMNAQKLNEAFKDGEVFFIFSANESGYFQGFAQMTSAVTKGEQQGWTSDFRVQWRRVCALAFSEVHHILNPLNDNLSIARSRDCQEVPFDTAQELLCYLMRKPKIELKDDGGREKLQLSVTPVPPPRGARSNGNFGAPPGVEVFQLAGSQGDGVGPGFLFGCNAATFEECFRLRLFGLPKKMERAARMIEVGSTLFLFNVADGKIWGVFEASSKAGLNIIPDAWAPPGRMSPFPVQVRFTISLKVPAIPKAQVQRTLTEAGCLDPETSHRLEFTPLPPEGVRAMINLFVSAKVKELPPGMPHPGVSVTLAVAGAGEEVARYLRYKGKPDEPANDHLKAIEKSTGAVIRLPQLSTALKLGQPLKLRITAPNEASFLRARYMCAKLIREARVKFVGNSPALHSPLQLTAFPGTAEAHQAAPPPPPPPHMAIDPRQNWAQMPGF